MGEGNWIFSSTIVEVYITSLNAHLARCRAGTVFSGLSGRELRMKNIMTLPRCANERQMRNVNGEGEM